MNRRTGRLVRWLALIIAGAATGCGSGDPGVAESTGGTTKADDSAIVVYAVNYPLAWFAERIGGEFASVRFPAPEGVDPAFWSPDAATVAAYQSADLILKNGAGYAAWTDRVSLPPSRLLDTSVGVRDRFLPVESAVTHTHGPEGEHSHDELATTTWLDPGIARAQAGMIRDALIEQRPEHSAAFEEGYRGLMEDLDRLEARLRIVAGNAVGEALLASHPVYQYLSAAYGLDVRSVHFEPDEQPDPGGWEALAVLRADRPSTIMLWEAEPLPAAAGRLDTLGVRVVVFEPSANRPATGDYLTTMEANVDRLEAAVGRP